MSRYWLLVPVLLPLLAGAGLLMRRPGERTRHRFCLGIVVLNLAVVALLVVRPPVETLTLVSWGPPLSLAFRLDGFGRVFGGLVAALWLPTTLYAFSYLSHGKGEGTFYGWFLMAFGVVEGVAFAGNLLTLYTCYELMTLLTLPLVMHGGGKKARLAGRQYLLYAVCGAAMAFLSFMLLLPAVPRLDFSLGGVLPPGQGGGGQLLLAGALGFLGFGVKAAVFPFFAWLPGASVAPTPVTALLHAVAVVKAGAFAVGRLTFYLLGPLCLRGTWVQWGMLTLAMLTILTGGVLALRTPHFKRRLAYSTIANLGYLLFSFSLLTPAGLVAGALHMLVHGVGKITLFFSAGAALHQTGREWLEELWGLGRRMPLTFGSFTVCALSLAGIPPFPGFSSKWLCARAALEEGSLLSLVGTGVLALSAVLAALYLGGIVLRVYFPPREEALPTGGADPDWRMKLPMGGLALLHLGMIVGVPHLTKLLGNLLSL